MPTLSLSSWVMLDTSHTMCCQSQSAVPPSEAAAAGVDASAVTVKDRVGASNIDHKQQQKQQKQKDEFPSSDDDGLDRWSLKQMLSDSSAVQCAHRTREQHKCVDRASV